MRRRGNLLRFHPDTTLKSNGIRFNLKRIANQRNILQPKSPSRAAYARAFQYNLSVDFNVATFRHSIELDWHHGVEAKRRSPRQ
jgi:hypothetical protein